LDTSNLFNNLNSCLHGSLIHHATGGPSRNMCTEQSKVNVKGYGVEL
jgi:hypothetical protein